MRVVLKTAYSLKNCFYKKIIKENSYANIEARLLLKHSPLREIVKTII